MEIVLIRHGQPEWTKDGRNVVDPPLTALGHEQAERQASEHEEAFETELLRLAIHGALHVLGHDHPDGPERWDSPMFDLQERLVEEVLAAD